MFTDVKNAVHSTFVNTYSRFISPDGTSKFLEDGTLTPEEFVAAGDLLTFKCPTWVWEKGEDSRIGSHLPPEKQFLVTRKVPCDLRVADLKNDTSVSYESLEVEGDDGWMLAVGDISPDGEDIPDMDVPDMDEPSNPPICPESKAELPDEDSDDIPDMDDFDSDDDLEEHDPACLPPKKEEKASNDKNTVIRTRSYDIHITYDKYYRTPRVWLFGYDEDGKPLKTENIFEDISQEHAHKTVTMDKHPHLGIPCAFIHPCRHAEVMKKFCDRLSGSGKELRVDQYFFLFLKFISTVIPTINYDFTISLDGQ